MAKRPIHKLRVEARTNLTPNMVRITLRGESLTAVPDDSVGGYMKLLLPRDAEIDVSALEPDDVDAAVFIKRSFTIRTLDVATRRMVLDFVSFGHPGAASDWLRSVQVGDAVLLTGPGPVKSLVHDADAFFLAADMAALPALAVQLERLPEDARGVAVIEVLEDGDRQTLDAPAGIDLRWVVNADATASQLAEAVRDAPWPQGRVSTWAACEFSTMKQLRAYFRDERGVAKDDGYLSSYWKLGATDEQHKAAKKADVTG